MIKQRSMTSCIKLLLVAKKIFCELYHSYLNSYFTSFHCSFGFVDIQEAFEGVAFGKLDTEDLVDMRKAFEAVTFEHMIKETSLFHR